MYVNKCIKCGEEFETKNPKRVICPNCLYSDKKYTEELSNEAANAATSQDESQPKSYSFGTENHEREYRSYDRNQNGGQRPYNNRNQGGYNRYNNNDRYNNNREGGYNRYNNDRPRRDDRGGNYQRPYNNNRNQGGYNRYNNEGGGQRRPSGNNRGGFQNRRPGGNRPKPQKQKQLLVSKEQLEQIEVLYKKALPLPNPDVHEIIGQAIELEPRKVFFGINLIRQKLMLPKLPFPKRKLAVSPDQLFAIKNLYEPLLPLPPIGCHKIIAAQLRMDEWRVHVGIGLIRKQMGLDRWNQDREDAPPEYKKQKEE